VWGGGAAFCMSAGDPVTSTTNNGGRYQLLCFDFHVCKAASFFWPAGSSLAFAVFCFELVGGKCFRMKRGVKVVFWSNWADLKVCVEIGICCSLLLLGPRWEEQFLNARKQTWVNINPSEVRRWFQAGIRVSELPSAMVLAWSAL